PYRERSGLDAHRLAEDVERRMDLEAFDALVIGGIDRTPKRLSDRAVLLHDLLELAQDFAARIDIERAFSLGEELIELLVRIGRLVPRHAGAVGKRQHHEAQGTMRPF